MAEFLRLRLGSEILRDELEYYCEVGLLEEVRVTLEIDELSTDGTRFLIQNTFLLENGKLIAPVHSKGGWLDLKARNLLAPPEELLLALQNSPRSDDIKEVAPNLKDAKTS